VSNEASIVVIVTQADGVTSPSVSASFRALRADADESKVEYPGFHDVALVRQETIPWDQLDHLLPEHDPGPHRGIEDLRKPTVDLDFRIQVQNNAVVASGKVGSRGVTEYCGLRRTR
jgi:hypothetical protein